MLISELFKKLPVVVVRVAMLVAAGQSGRSRAGAGHVVRTRAVESVTAPPLGRRAGHQPAPEVRLLAGRTSGRR